MLTCRDCQSHLTAYLHRELTPKMRRRVALHLNQCDRCANLYAAERDLSQELAFAVPQLGQPDAAQIRRIWSAIEAEQSQPSAPHWTRYTTRYGFAGLLLMLALLIPMTVRSQQMGLSLPLQPVPQTQMAAGTPPSHVVTVAQALPVYPGHRSEVRFAPVSSPAIAPSTVSNPAPAATDTP